MLLRGRIQVEPSLYCEKNEESLVQVEKGDTPSLNRGMWWRTPMATPLDIGMGRGGAE